MSLPEGRYFEFAKSITPLWRHGELVDLRQRGIHGQTSVVDISSTGHVHGGQVGMTESEMRYGQEYQSRLEMER
jgi:hypothetical protein